MDEGIEDRDYRIIREFIETGDSYDTIAERLGISIAVTRDVLVKADLKGFTPRITGITLEEPHFVEVTSKVLIKGNKVVHLFPSQLNF